jgi:hypothetical protein
MRKTPGADTSTALYVAPMEIFFRCAKFDRGFRFDRGAQIETPAQPKPRSLHAKVRSMFCVIEFLVSKRTLAHARAGPLWFIEETRLRTKANPDFSGISEGKENAIDEQGP